jgi:hypothetical protein
MSGNELEGVQPVNSSRLIVGWAGARRAAWARQHVFCAACLLATLACSTPETQAPAQPAIHELFEAPKRPNDVVVEERMSLDSRPGSIRRWRRGSPHPYIEVDIDAPGRTPEQHFNAIAHCTTAVACGEAEAIVRTVRFLR